MGLAFTGILLEGNIDTFLELEKVIFVTVQILKS